ncbi:MAG: MATE family efflux transporter [Eubacteriales bacterium]|nr:MATE family efflux transporter [Eubacteriales bacterium]
MSRIKDMTKGKPSKLLLMFAVPLMIGNLGQQLYMVADAVIVGRGVGVEALAAVGATDWTYWLILWTIQAMTQGFATRLSQYFGAGDKQELRKGVAMSITLCGVIGIVFTAIGLFLVYPMLHILKTPENIFDSAASYLITLFLGTVIVMAYNMAAAILRALGDGKTPMIAIAVAACTNIVLDLLFILVFRWGIVGAAVATLIAQLIAFLYCFMVLKNIEIIRTSREDWIVDWPAIKRLCQLGVPLALQHVLIAVGGMILQSTINRYGFLFVAGFTATNKIYGLLESSAISLGYAATTYMAQNYGAGLNERIHKGMKSITIMAVLMSVCVSAVMLFGGKAVLSLFVSSGDANGGEVLNIAYHYLVIMSCLLWFLYLLHGWRSAIQGLGNAIIPMISGVAEFVMRVAAALIFTRIWGSEAIFYAEPCAWAGAAILLIAGGIRILKKIT